MLKKIFLLTIAAAAVSTGVSILRDDSASTIQATADVESIPSDQTLSHKAATISTPHVDVPNSSMTVTSAGTNTEKKMPHTVSVTPNITVFQKPILDAVNEIFAQVEATGHMPDDLFQALQKRIETDDEALHQVMSLIEDKTLSSESKYTLAELIATRQDNAPIDFAMNLLQDDSAQSQSVGTELATSIMMHGRPADILAPIVQGSYTPEAAKQVGQVLSRVPNAPMTDIQKVEVESLLTNYIDTVRGEMRSAAIESLSGVIAGDGERLKSLFNHYHTDESTEVRYSAIEALNQLNPDQFDDQLAQQLTMIANNPKESMSVRSSAMQLLANYKNN